MIRQHAGLSFSGSARWPASHPRLGSEDLGADDRRRPPGEVNDAPALKLDTSVSTLTRRRK